MAIEEESHNEKQIFFPNHEPTIQKDKRSCLKIKLKPLTVNKK